MAFIILLVVIASSVLMTRATCPSGCRCQAGFKYGQSGSDVDCSDDQLMNVFPSSFPTNVLQLDFSHNSLDRVPNGIRHLSEMRVLNLSNNGIYYKVQNNIFENNVNLLVLDLSGNMISSFSSNSFVGLGKLEVLDIHSNLIVSFPVELLHPLPATLSMCIGSNHWHCSCDMFSALVERFLITSENASLSCRGGEPECRSPPTLDGKRFSTITGEEEMCGSEQPGTTSEISETSVSTTLEQATTERSHRSNFLMTTDAVIEINNQEIDLVVQRNEAVAQDNPDHEAGLFLNKEIVTYGMIVLGGMVLLIFLLLALVFSKTMSKRRLVKTERVHVEEGKSQCPASPWPLLHSQRRLPEIVHTGNDPVHSSDYQEIPAKFQKWDEKVELAEEEDGLRGGAEKLLYTTSLGDDWLQSTSENTYLAPGTGTDAYIPMRASVLARESTKQTDLYSPMEAQA